MLVRIDDVDDIDIVRQLLRAQEYWRLKRLAVDLVFLNERAASYVQDLQSALETQLRMSQSRPRLGADNSKGAVFHPAHRPHIGAGARTAVVGGAGGAVRPAREPGGAARP